MGVEDCKFLRQVNSAAAGSGVTGGDRAGYSRVLIVSGDLSLGAALQALDDRILQCKKCGKSESDADCDECPYKGVMLSPKFSPKSPPKPREFKFPTLDLQEIFKLQGNLGNRNENDDRDKARDKARDKDRDRNSRNSRGGKNKER